jgi:cyclophilin family peptidyl-prolyl cis-trans isomerase
MMRKLLLLTALLGTLAATAQEKRTYALLTTPYGDIKVLLYDATPRHRDNFVKLAEERFYDQLMFHRIIENFIVQGGDPESRNAGPLQTLGTGGPGYLLDPEFGAGVHIRGALAAARQDNEKNPEKKSSGSQFYLVQGEPVTDADLDQWEGERGIRYTPEQRARYKEMGGLPYLDNEYTVFGEVVEGLDVLARMSQAGTGRYNRPVEDTRMVVRILRE